MTFYDSSEFGRTISEAGDMAAMPKFSTALDSIRPYQWEIEFQMPGGATGVAGKYLTVAAKQVSEVGFTVEDIEVHRVNDRYYYPGKATPEEVTVTFDNMKKNPLGGEQMALAELYKWIQNTYDPLTGDFGDIQGSVKANMKIHQLDEDLSPIASVTLYGAYPKSYKTAEYNYATATDMHTLTVSFRYDFMSAESPTG